MRGRGHGARRTRGAAALAGALLVAGLCGCAAADDGTPRTATVPATEAAEPAAEAQPAAVATAPAAPADAAATPEDAAAPADAAPPAFASTVTPITPELAARMQASWRPGCPVPLEQLRYVTASHHDMAGGVRTGELVVHAEVADGLVAVLRTLFDAGFPIASMRLVDDFGADDDASMAADNTSAFNCRAVTGGTGWSEHSYGRAIDVNPVENPYVRGTTVLPPAGAAFADRHAAPGVVLDGDVVVQAFAAHGWQWGGHWTSPRDHQHFSTTGR